MASHTLKGVVVSNAARNTAVVEVVRRKKHLRYNKYISVSKRYKAHTDEYIPINSVAVIAQTRPMSSQKRWRVVSYEKPKSEIIEGAVDMAAENNEQADNSKNI